MAPPSGLRIRARDDEDLGVVAAVLQDALIPLGDMTYQKSQRRFVLVANRFMWEDEAAMESFEEAPVEPAATPPPERDASFEEEAPPPRFRRVNCGVRFEPIRSVKLRGIDLRHRDHILNMLTIEPPSTRIDDARIRLYETPDPNHQALSPKRNQCVRQMHCRRECRALIAVRSA